MSDQQFAQQAAREALEHIHSNLVITAQKLRAASNSYKQAADKILNTN
ncbi:hypothetical protein [Vibrio viridaestus]|nr:hypothetical protein [Vibrio viridaestus]